jgi:hypothetical protein
MLRTLGNVAGNVASTVASGVGRIVDIRPTYRQIGNYVVKGASYESFDSSGLFGSWGSGSSDSSGYFSSWGSGSSGGVSGDSSGYFSGLGSSFGISGDSSGYFSGLGSSFGISGDSSGVFGQGIGQIGSGWWGASGGTDASDGSGGGISSYLPSGGSAGIAFGISAVMALFPVALILNHMITMPLIMRIFAAIVVYIVCLVNPFMAILIYLFYALRAALRYNAGEKYLLFPFFGFWPLRVRKVTDGTFITALTWMFSYLDPDLSKERHVKQRNEYVANAELYVASLVNTLRLPPNDITGLGINKLAQKVLDKLIEPLTGPSIQKVEESAESVAPSVNNSAAPSVNTPPQKNQRDNSAAPSVDTPPQKNQRDTSVIPPPASAVPNNSAVSKSAAVPNNTTVPNSSTLPKSTVVPNNSAVSKSAAVLNNTPATKPAPSANAPSTRNNTTETNPLQKS